MRKLIEGLGSLFTIVLLFVAFRFVRIVVVLSVTTVLIIQGIRFSILHSDPFSIEILKGMIYEICNKYYINKDVKIIMMDNLSSTINPNIRVSVTEYSDEFEIKVNMKYCKMYERVFSTLGDFNIIRNTIRMVSIHTNKKIPILSETLIQTKKLFKPGNN